MSWRDQLREQSHQGVSLQGSFRGVPFIVPSSEAAVGRRNQVHEYPLRDQPWVEDLGRRARRFEIEAFVDTSLVDDGRYMAARDALIEALEAPGPGTLVHPWYGRLRVVVVETRVREATRSGGRATFRVTFAEAGEERYPQGADDTAAQVEIAADAASAAAIEGFAVAWSVDGLPGWTLVALEAEVDRTLAAIDNLVTGVADAVSAEIRAPYNMGAAIVGGAQAIATSATEPLRAIRLYEELFDAGKDSPAVPATTATRRAQSANVSALQSITRQAAVIEAARQAARAEYTTLQGAQDAQRVVLAGIDDLQEYVSPLGEPVSDAVYQSLQALRQAVVADIRARGLRLPRLGVYTPATTLPALVVAYQVYGDASREAELVARNGIRHPGFVTGGETLEVLVDE